MAQCGAKTRSGEPCKRHASPGSKRCKLHGGAASKANRNNKHAATPGSIYSQYFTDEERVLADQLELGRVDDELRLTRIRLRRALAREDEYGNTLELDSEKVEPLEIEGKDTGLSKTTTISKVRDYAGLIDRLTARIESLERTRAELAKTNPPEDTPVGRIQIEIVGGNKNASSADDGAAS